MVPESPCQWRHLGVNGIYRESADGRWRLWSICSRAIAVGWSMGSRTDTSPVLDALG